MAGITWTASNIYEPLPFGAFRVGMDTDGSAIFVGRTFAMGDYLVVKIIPDRKYASASHEGQEIPVYSYGVLCGNGYSWIESKHGLVPHGAIVGGKTSVGEVLYIGRVSFQGSLTPGKIVQSHACIYIPFEGREHGIGYYEVLVQTNKNEPRIMANPNLQMNIPQQIQISAPHPLIFQKPEGHIIYQNGQNILMNGQYAQIASIAQHNMNNNYHALNLGPLNPAILNSAPQILQYSMSTVQQSSIDPNDQNIQKIAKIPPSFLPIASNSVSQILPNPLAISNKAQKPLQNGPNPQQIIPKVAKKYLLNGKQINVPPPGVQAIMDQPSPKIGAQIMIPMQNLQISNGGSSTPTLLSTNPFRDNASPPVRVPSVSKTPIVLPDVRIPPPKPPIHVEGYYNVPPPQLPPNYRPYKEHFPMITEVNDLAKANKLSISQVSKSSAPAPVPEDSLEAVFSKASTSTISAINFSVPPPNYAKIIQLNMSDDNNKNIKPVVAGTAINSVVKQAVGINPANVINSYSPIKQVNHVNQKPQIINGQTVPGKLPIKQPMETKVPPTQDDDSCVICLDNPQDAVLYKCGHPMCYDCALNQWKAPTGGTCPICRATIVDVMRVFKV